MNVCALSLKIFLLCPRRVFAGSTPSIENSTSETSGVSQVSVGAIMDGCSRVRQFVDKHFNTISDASEGEEPKVEWPGG
ncbi:hypothetical protein T265_08830 [Opisthorchis viverrini]|uniref:Secreted protein n=1 Tax=Opisthorchis viverrini TaxID=6198 RepID=A0A074Z829_OPIVI|nr:hypothetical protein T265_08830 [Opisthorchis viverrini]KER23258.1 hypothetical protein T265_08830 [Opisthorchis viverrini]